MSEDAIGIVAAILLTKVAAVPTQEVGGIWTEKNTVEQWQALRTRLQTMTGPAAEHL